jgi:methionyl-tRNA formyltransferase
VNALEQVEAVRKLGAELHVSMSYDQILREPMLKVPRRGTLNCHAGALPFYRGRNPLTWALINGEPEFGVTVHWVDEGIDTGDIVLQVKSPIAVDDNYATLLRRAYIICADTLVEAVERVYQGRDTRTPQSSIDAVGLYCCRRREGDEEIDWNWKSQFIAKFVRALVPPGPGARTRAGDRVFAISAAELLPNSRAYVGIPGEVVDRGPEGILVKTEDTLLLVREWASVGPDGAIGKATIADIPRGTRLGRSLTDEVNRLRLQVAEMASLVATLSSNR